MHALPPPEEMERAYTRSDESYDGVFFLAVRTTGIFCRPSCPARKPLPENVEYFSGARDALFAGYRPCKRCRPMEAHGAPPDWVVSLLARVEEDPEARLRDADLREMGVDPARARRFFVKTYGMTFQAYCRGRRLGRAFESIRKGEDLDEVTLGHGWESYSGFRDAFSKTFGQPPGKARGADCIRLALVETPLGPMVAGATSDGICLLEFTNRRMLEAQFTTLRRRFRCAIVPGNNGHLEKVKDELGKYFAGELTRFQSPLVYPGTEFQRKVWDALVTIPYGETRSYEGLAKEIQNPGAIRAVGTANGMNRIAILVPCHRVVNKDGKLGGYGGGLWRKQALLDLERRKGREG
jgi:AraC family transcriptional regulator of adaptative response/methylated-DNA-[protein]-cysteine methyltransferase